MTFDKTIYQKMKSHKYIPEDTPYDRAECVFNTLTDLDQKFISDTEM